MRQELKEHVDQLSKLLLSVILGLAIGFLLQVFVIEIPYLNGSLSVGLIGGPVLSWSLYKSLELFSKDLGINKWTLILFSILGALVAYFAGVVKDMPKN